MRAMFALLLQIMANDREVELHDACITRDPQTCIC